MKCARTACTNKADGRLVHVDTGRRYCAPCARRINEGGVVIPFPDGGPTPKTYPCACGCGVRTINPPQTGLIHDGVFMDFKSPGNAFATTACKSRFVAAVRAMLVE